MKSNFISNNINEFDIIVSDNFLEYFKDCDLKPEFIFDENNCMDFGKVMSLNDKSKILLSQKDILYIEKDYGFLLRNKKIAVFTDFLNDDPELSDLKANGQINYDSVLLLKDIKRLRILDEIENFSTESFDNILNYSKDKKIYLLEKDNDLLRLLEERKIYSEVISKKTDISNEKICFIINKINIKKYNDLIIKLILNNNKVEIINFNYLKINKAIEEIDYKSLLKSYFDYDDFREIIIKNNENKDKIISQKDIIKYILNEFYYPNKKVRDAILVNSTGSGKSLIFQFVAKYLFDKENLITIVIEPLKAIMVDQVDYLQKRFGEFVEKLNSDTSRNQKDKIIENISSNKTSMLYISPEFFANNNIKKILSTRKIGLFVIDEAHVVSSWGNTFRADYGYLGEYIDSLKEISDKNVVKIALTATIVRSGKLSQMNEIINYLRLNDPEIFYANIRKENIIFDIKQVEIKDKKENIDKKIRELIIENVDKNIAENNKSIVYCTYLKQIDKFKDETSEYNEEIGFYTGKTEKNERNRIINDFKNNRKKVIFATKAFGMGVNIEDIREVIHYKLPVNLVDYLQEIGRAGRDQKESFSRVYFNEKFSLNDSYKLEAFSIPRKWQLNKVYEILKNKILSANQKNKLVRVSVNEFMHIFKEAKEDDLIRSIRTALFIIEKSLEEIYKRKVLFKTYEGLKEIYVGVKTQDDEKFNKIPYAAKINEKPDSYFNEYSSKNTIVRSIYKIDVEMMLDNYIKDVSSNKFSYDFYSGDSKKYFNEIEASPYIRFEVKNIDIDWAFNSFEKLLNFFTRFVNSSESFKTFKKSKNIDFEEINNELDSFFKKDEEINNLKSTDLKSSIKIIFYNLYVSDSKNYTMSLIYRNDLGYFVRSREFIEKINKKLIDIFKSNIKKDNLLYFFSPEKYKNEVIVKIINILKNIHNFDLVISGGKNGLIEYKYTVILKDHIEITKTKELKEKLDEAKKLSLDFFSSDMSNSERWDYLERIFSA